MTADYTLVSMNLSYNTCKSNHSIHCLTCLGANRVILRCLIKLVNPRLIQIDGVRSSLKLSSRTPFKLINIISFCPSYLTAGYRLMISSFFSTATSQLADGTALTNRCRFGGEGMNRTALGDSGQLHRLFAVEGPHKSAAVRANPFAFFELECRHPFASAAL